MTVVSYPHNQYLRLSVVLGKVGSVSVIRGIATWVGTAALAMVAGSADAASAADALFTSASSGRVMKGPMVLASPEIGERTQKDRCALAAQVAALQKLKIKSKDMVVIENLRPISEEIQRKQTYLVRVEGRGEVQVQVVRQGTSLDSRCLARR